MSPLRFSVLRAVSSVASWSRNTSGISRFFTKKAPSSEGEGPEERFPLLREAIERWKVDNAGLFTKDRDPEHPDEQLLKEVIERGKGDHPQLSTDEMYNKSLSPSSNCKRLFSNEEIMVLLQKTEELSPKNTRPYGGFRISGSFVPINISEESDPQTHYPQLLFSVPGALVLQCFKGQAVSVQVRRPEAHDDAGYGPLALDEHSTTALESALNAIGFSYRMSSGLNNSMHLVIPVKQKYHGNLMSEDVPHQIARVLAKVLKEQGIQVPGICLEEASPALKKHWETMLEQLSHTSDAPQPPKNKP